LLTNLQELPVAWLSVSFTVAAFSRHFPISRCISLRGS